MSNALTIDALNLEVTQATPQRHAPIVAVGKGADSILSVLVDILYVTLLGPVVAFTVVWPEFILKYHLPFLILSAVPFLHARIGESRTVSVGILLIPATAMCVLGCLIWPVEIRGSIVPAIIINFVILFIVARISEVVPFLLYHREAPSTCLYLCFVPLFVPLYKSSPGLHFLFATVAVGIVVAVISIVRTYARRLAQFPECSLQASRCLRSIADRSELISLVGRPYRVLFRSSQARRLALYSSFVLPSLAGIPYYCCFPFEIPGLSQHESLILLTGLLGCVVAGNVVGICPALLQTEPLGYLKRRVASIVESLSLAYPTTFAPSVAGRAVRLLLGITASLLVPVAFRLPIFAYATQASQLVFLSYLILACLVAAVLAATMLLFLVVNIVTPFVVHCRFVADGFIRPK